MNIEYVYLNHNTSEQYRDGFIEIYKEAFGRAPYFEKYTNEEISDEIWIPHLLNGVIVVACDTEHDGSVVGIGCAIPFLKSPDDIQEFLKKREKKELPMEFNNVWYISEFGVLKKYEGNGIGTQIIIQLNHHILNNQCNYFVTRTAKIGSNSIGIFKGLGAIELPEHQDVSKSDQCKEKGSKSEERTYLYCNCKTALESHRSKKNKGRH